MKTLVITVFALCLIGGVLGCRRKSETVQQFKRYPHEQHGRLEAIQIDHWKQQQQPVTCAVEKGGALLMRPLLLHSSLAGFSPGHRRVLHFEYSSIDLPGGLRWFEDDELELSA